MATDMRPINYGLAVFGAADLFGLVKQSTLRRWYPGTTGRKFVAPVLELRRLGFLDIIVTDDGLAYKKRN